MQCIYRTHSIPLSIFNLWFDQHGLLNNFLFSLIYYYICFHLCTMLHIHYSQQKMRHMLESWWSAWYLSGSVCIADRNLPRKCLRSYDDRNTIMRNSNWLIMGKLANAAVPGSNYLFRVWCVFFWILNNSCFMPCCFIVHASHIVKLNSDIVWICKY